MSREIDNICSYLKTKSIIVPSDNEWVLSCVKCFKEQGIHSLMELRELVFQQWLLADLCDIRAQAVPNDLFNNEKYILHGRYAVQVNYIVNVAVSFHKQLQKIRRPEATRNLELHPETSSGYSKEDESGHRTLKLEFTDGVFSFVGFEDQFIHSLQEPFVPGMKVVLVGPIECFKSVLFLKNNSIVLLGGEVEGLLSSNATENVLARALKLVENPDPYFHMAESRSRSLINNPLAIMESEEMNDDEEALIMAVASVEKNESEVESKKKNSKIVPQCINHGSMKQTEQNEGKNMSQIDDFDLSIESAAPVGSSLSCNQTVDSIASEFHTYEMFASSPAIKDFETINCLKQKLTDSYGKQSSVDCTMHENEQLTFKEGKILVDYLNDEISPLVRLPEGSEEDRNVLNTPECVKGNLFSVDPFPPRKRPAVVTTHAEVIKVLGIPKIVNSAWSINAVVKAKGFELEVNFSPDAIDKVFTVSAEAINAQRKQSLLDPLEKQRLNEAFKQSQKRFKKLSCLMTFNFRDSISDPVITDVMIDR